MGWHINMAKACFYSYCGPSQLQDYLQPRSQETKILQYCTIRETLGSFQKTYCNHASDDFLQILL